LVAKGALGIAYVTAGAVYFSLKKVWNMTTERREPVFPWYEKVKLEQQSLETEDTHNKSGETVYEYQFRARLLGVLALRGVFEFLGGFFYIFCLKMALEYGVNQGVSSCMLSMAGLIITVASCLIYDERLNVPQCIGIISMMTALPFLGMYAVRPTELGVSHLSFTEMVKVGLPGLCSAVSFSLEALLIRYCANRGVSGMDGGFICVSFNGVFSCIILACIASSNTLPLSVFFNLFLAGLCTTSAIVLVNVAVVHGEAGIAFSIGNSFPCWHSIYNTVVVGQPLSLGQIMGVVLVVLGSIVLSVHDHIDCCTRKPSKEEEEVAGN